MSHFYSNLLHSWQSCCHFHLTPLCVHVHAQVHDVEQEEGKEKHVNSCLFAKVQLLLALRNPASAEMEMNRVWDSDDVHMSSREWSQLDRPEEKQGSPGGGVHRSRNQVCQQQSKQKLVSLDCSSFLIWGLPSPSWTVHAMVFTISSLSCKNLQTLEWWLSCPKRGSTLIHGQANPLCFRSRSRETHFFCPSDQAGCWQAFWVSRPSAVRAWTRRELLCSSEKAEWFTDSRPSVQKRLHHWGSC